MRSLFAKYYRPGLITLIFLPLMCSPMLYKHFFPQKLYALEVTTSCTNNETGSYPLPPVRNYKNVELNGNPGADEKSLRVIAVMINNIIATKDSTSGIDIKLGNNMRYQTLVTLVDICSFEKTKGYGWKEDNFWIAPFTRTKEIVRTPAPCGNTRLGFKNYTSGQKDESNPTLWEVFTIFFTLHKAQ